MGLTIDRGDYAYFKQGVYELYEKPSQDAPMPTGIWSSLVGWVIQGLAQYYRVSGYEPAKTLAGKLTRYLRYHGGYYDPEDCAFKPNRPGSPSTHLHHHLLPLLGVQEYAMLVGDHELMEWVRRGYEHGKTFGETTVGFFPEHLHIPDYQTSETCEVADMIALGLKLTEAGVGDYLDDVDRWTRNQFVENQLVRADWIEYVAEAGLIDSRARSLVPTIVDESYQTTENVPQRNIGSFAGWPAANDWFVGHGSGIMHCCTGNGARALYYVWENIISYADGRLKVNLLLNRASPWADIDSYIPYEGRVDVKIKQPCELSIRIPEWVKPEETVAKVGDEAHQVGWDGRYAKFGAVKPGDVATLAFPIQERTESIYIEKTRYRIVRKGNDVVYIDPPGRFCPLYQRAHYRENQVRWRKIERFVSDEAIHW